MNDRKLLELASKAAGIDMQHRAMFGGDAEPGYYNEHAKWLWWNPLVDDGDALRLAVRLQLQIEHSNEFAFAQGDTPPWPSAKEPVGDDRLAATRRAIVRAAAEIGRAKSG